MPRPTAPADTSAHTHTAHPQPEAHRVITERAVIGDQLRRPTIWCEIESCISWHADPAALGEADIRARAITAGWSVDALGRLACPRCQQISPGFRASHQVMLWDRDVAITRTAQMAAGHSDGTPTGPSSRDRHSASRHPSASALKRGRHRKVLSSAEMSAGQPKRYISREACKAL